MGIAESIEKSLGKKPKTMAAKLAETYERRAGSYEDPAKKVEFYERAAEKFLREGMFTDAARCYSLAGRWSESYKEGRPKAGEFYDRAARLFEDESKNARYSREDKAGFRRKADAAFSSFQRMERLMKAMEADTAVIRKKKREKEKAAVA